jgi:hypothetical protein
MTAPRYLKLGHQHSKALLNSKQQYPSSSGSRGVAALALATLLFNKTDVDKTYDFRHLNPLIFRGVLKKNLAICISGRSQNLTPSLRRLHVPGGFQITFSPKTIISMYTTSFLLDVVAVEG